MLVLPWSCSIQFVRCLTTLTLYSRPVRNGYANDQAFFFLTPDGEPRAIDITDHGLQIACTREPSACRRCVDDKTSCVYSREGVVRRKRKRKDDTTEELSILTPAPSIIFEGHGNPARMVEGLQSHLCRDIELACDRLDGRDASQQTSIGALTSLSDASAAVWHSTGQFEQSSKHYFVFRERTDLWVESKSITTFEATIRD